MMLVYLGISLCPYLLQDFFHKVDLDIVREFSSPNKMITYLLFTL